jgi:multidrug efflux pump subunit AcrB
VPYLASVEQSGATTSTFVPSVPCELPAGASGSVPVGAVARIEERETLSRIVRENQQYERFVTYEFRGPAAAGERLRDAVVAGTQLPAGYTAAHDAPGEDQADGGRELWAVVGLAAVLVFMISGVIFESYRLPLCVLLSAPLALVGVFTAFALARAEIGREAQIGAILSAGLAVNGAILLLHSIGRSRGGRGDLHA